MNVERLSEFVEQPEVHRRVLGDHRGPYALGVTQSENGNAALELSVPLPERDQFPSKIDLAGESVPVIVRTNWKPPVPL